MRAFSYGGPACLKFERGSLPVLVITTAFTYLNFRSNSVLIYDSLTLERGETLAFYKLNHCEFKTLVFLSNFCIPYTIAIFGLPIISFGS